MDRSAILLHVHTSLYDIPLQVHTYHCGQSVYYYHVRLRLFLCIVNNTKGLHFSAFIILWLIYTYVCIYMYGILNCDMYTGLA